MPESSAAPAGHPDSSALGALARPSGAFAMLAMDQRVSLETMFAAGGPPIRGCRARRLPRPRPGGGRATRLGHPARTWLSVPRRDDPVARPADRRSSSRSTTCSSRAGLAGAGFGHRPRRSRSLPRAGRQCAQAAGHLAGGRRRREARPAGGHGREPSWSWPTPRACPRWSRSIAHGGTRAGRAARDRRRAAGTAAHRWPAARTSTRHRCPSTAATRPRTWSARSRDDREVVGMPVGRAVHRGRRRALPGARRGVAVGVARPASSPAAPSGAAPCRHATTASRPRPARRLRRGPRPARVHRGCRGPTLDGGRPLMTLGAIPSSARSRPTSSGSRSPTSTSCVDPRASSGLAGAVWRARAAPGHGRRPSSTRAIADGVRPWWTRPPSTSGARWTCWSRPPAPSGMHIVAATGMWLAPSPASPRAPRDQLADWFTADVDDRARWHGRPGGHHQGGQRAGADALRGAGAGGRRAGARARPARPSSPTRSPATGWASSRPRCWSASASTRRRVVIGHSDDATDIDYLAEARRPGLSHRHGPAAQRPPAGVRHPGVAARLDMIAALVGARLRRPPGAVPRRPDLGGRADRHGPGRHLESNPDVISFIPRIVAARAARAGRARGCHQRA